MMTKQTKFTLVDLEKLGFRQITPVYFSDGERFLCRDSELGSWYLRKPGKKPKKLANTLNDAIGKLIALNEKPSNGSKPKE
jgi:hypothetical protein